MMKKQIILLLTACVWAACGNEKQAETTVEAENAPEENAVATEEEAEADAPAGREDFSLNGIITIAPSHHASITVLMGGTVHSLNVRPGQFVKKGEVIATLNNPEFVDLQQTYLEAEAQVEFQETDYARQQGLASYGAASQKTQQQSKAEYLSMKSRLNAAAMRLEQLGISPSTLKAEGIRAQLAIISPISGYAGNLEANIGKYLSPGDRICDVINTNEMYLELNSYEKDLVTVRTGDKLAFRVNPYPTERFEATVMYIDPIEDESSHSVKVYAKITKGTQKLRSGMYVRASLQGTE